MTVPPRLGLSNLGVGVGLRAAHFSYVESQAPEVDWFEVISENVLDSGGRPRRVLDWVAGRYPVVLHGVSMSIGSTDPLDFDYLARLRRLAASVKPAWISDHLCWTGVGGVNTHELLPIPFTEASLAHVIRRVQVVQDYLERPLVLENPSTYVSFAASTMTEWEFLSRLAIEAGCGLLLDVNNAFVSGRNHGFDPADLVCSLPRDHVVQIHLAGHADRGSHLVDSHDRPVAEPVWELFRLATALMGPVSTLVEWDDRLPPFPELLAEARKADQVMRSCPRPRSQGPDAPGPVAPRRGSPSGELKAPDPACAEAPLAAVQEWMLGEILTSSNSPTDRQPVATEWTRSGAVVSTTPLELDGRLELYRRSARRRLLECLQAMYPALRVALGDELFDAFALEYLESNPSRSYTLAEVGRGFAGHLLDTRPDRHQPAERRQGWIDFVVDLAMLERLFFELYEGPGPEGRRLPSSSSLPELLAKGATVTVQPVPGLRLFYSEFPVGTYLWSARRGERPPLPGAAPSHFVLIRRQYRVTVEAWSRPPSLTLARLLEGASLAEAAAAVGLAPDEAWTWVRRWVDQGYFLDVAVAAGAASGGVVTSPSSGSAEQVSVAVATSW